ncbi:uncharacterized protein LOC131662193 [Vicia villosa]|uniref:uncharacterized protein LOC131662193 n=1 Tax=Vicia villosa TaxID=3911 RepID=UPI00273B388B|nr:uncharacterized protein LOC131662193 [Vicia villosa]
MAIKYFVIANNRLQTVMKQGMFASKYPLSVTNTYNVTKVAINEDLEPIKNFAKSITKENMKALSNHRSSQSQVTFCSTVATTQKLIASRFGWYKIEVDVVHGRTKCNFVLWDKESEQLLDMSAAHMRTTMIEKGVNDPLKFPLALDKMLGLEIAFKVKWQPDWKNFSVVMLLRDEGVINQLKAPWPSEISSISEPINAPALQINESVDERGVVDECDVITDLKITSKHNPEPVTPTAKRQAPDGSSESTTMKNLCNGELSSTKLKT